MILAIHRNSKKGQYTYSCSISKLRINAVDDSGNHRVEKASYHLSELELVSCKESEVFAELTVSI